MTSTALFLGLLTFATPVLNFKYPPYDADSLKTFCNHEASVETFSTSFFSAMLAKFGFEYNGAATVPGSVAERVEYANVKELLQRRGVMDADVIATRASTAFAKIKTVKFYAYLGNVAHTVGQFLNQFGVLNCSTAIPLAFDYFKFVDKELHGSNLSFPSYVKAVVGGLVKFVLKQGLNLDDSFNAISRQFVEQSNSGNQDNEAKPNVDLFHPPGSADTSHTFCYHELSVETFTSALYTILLVKQGFGKVAALEVPGNAAADMECKIVRKILHKQGLCNADEIALTASQPLAQIETLKLAVYFEKSAHSLGEFLRESELLNCSTAIPLALDYYQLFEKEFLDASDENNFGSYMQAVVEALVDFIREHKLALEDSAKNLAYLFSREFSSRNQDSCLISKD